MKIVKKVERIIKESPVGNKSYDQHILIEKKPYDFGNVKTISENTNKPQNKNVNTYGSNNYGHTNANIQYSVWY